MLGLIAINTNTVHADAINWNNVNVDSEDVGADKSVKSSVNDVKTSNVQSTQLNERNFVKTSNVQAEQINKTKIAQFNSNSKIYGLNNSNELSKNNGDGYVITNAGTYNGHQVDIGVTINNVQNNQGSYTTKWSNGDKVSQTGNVDNSFNYQNGVTVNSNVLQPVAPNQTRTRTEVKNNTYQLDDVFVGIENVDGTNRGLYLLDPVDLAKVLGQRKIVNTPANYDKVLQTAGELLSTQEHGDVGFYYAGQNDGYYSYTNNDRTHEYTLESVSIPKFNDWFNQHKNDFNDEFDSGGDMTYSKAVYIFNNLHDLTGTYDPGLGNKIGATPVGHGKTIPVWGAFYKDNGKYTVDDANDYVNSGSRASLDTFGDDFKKDAAYSFVGPTNVTDHLQIDQVKNGNLNYDYTIGLYDHNTGDLITSLKPEYKDGVKVGKTATTADTVMNNAIKNKIADIRNNKAAVAFNGTAANDNVAFYQETTPVQDVSKLTATASRTITLHFPNNQKPASYDSLVNSNNQIVQTLKFTRTGTTDLVTGQTTYTNWQGDSKFPDVKLPKIPGFKLQIS